MRDYLFIYLSSDEEEAEECCLPLWLCGMIASLLLVYDNQFLIGKISISISAP
jgi:hypothetical protein